MESPKFSRGCTILFFALSILVGCFVSNVVGLFDTPDSDGAAETVEMIVLFIIPEPMFKNLEGLD